MADSGDNTPRGRTDGPAGPARRSAGRPGPVEQAVGRDTLIAAACELLTELPPNEVTRALVARRVNVHPSLIRYYFQDRSRMLVAAAERLTAEYADSLEAALALSDGTPVSRLSIRVKTLLDLEAKYPFFHRLIVDEVLGSEAPSAKEMITKLTHRALGDYQLILQDGVGRGDFRELDPQMVFVSIMGMCEFFTSAIKLVQLNPAEPVDKNAFVERYKAFVVDFILNGLCKSVRPGCDRSFDA